MIVTIQLHVAAYILGCFFAGYTLPLTEPTTEGFISLVIVYAGYFYYSAQKEKEQEEKETC